MFAATASLSIAVSRIMGVDSLAIVVYIQYSTSFYRVCTCRIAGIRYVTITSSKEQCISTCLPGLPLWPVFISFNRLRPKQTNQRSSLTLHRAPITGHCGVTTSRPQLGRGILEAESVQLDCPSVRQWDVFVAFAAEVRF